MKTCNRQYKSLLLLFSSLVPRLYYSTLRSLNLYPSACAEELWGRDWRGLPCSMKVLRVLIFANFRSAKISSHRKKNPQNKTLQKLTPFSQIKNSAFNALVVYGRDRLLFCFAVVQSLCSLCTVRYYSDYRIILHLICK